MVPKTDAVSTRGLLVATRPFLEREESEEITTNGVGFGAIAGTYENGADAEPHAKADKDPNATQTV